MVIGRAGNQVLEDRRFDGNHCIATDDPHPWQKQLNIYLAYASFYNPVNFVRAVANWKDPSWDWRVAYQVCGMAGLAKSVAEGWSWAWNLYRGPIQKLTAMPPRKALMVAAVAPGQPAPVMQFGPA
jgi:hypothetical protein